MSPPSVAVLRQIVGPDVKSLQSMRFVNNAGKPCQSWHQDETFIPARGASHNGAWIALDDATLDNGCLWLQPGSHPRCDGASESFGWQGPHWPADSGVAAGVSAGSVVFCNGYTLHRSLHDQRSSGFRRALVNHAMSAQPELPWPCLRTETATA